MKLTREARRVLRMARAGVAGLVEWVDTHYTITPAGRRAIR